MNFFEAMEEMRKGKKIKLKSWPDEKYLGIKEEESKVFGRKRIKYTVITENEENLSPCVPFSILVSSQWCLVDED